MDHTDVSIREVNTYSSSNDSILPTFRDDSEYSIGSDPHLGMNLIIRNNLAHENVTGEQVVVHGFLNDDSDGRVGELEEGVMFRRSSLVRQLCLTSVVSTGSSWTL